MKELINKLNKFYKDAIKKFNNFRLTSTILGGVSLLSGIVSLGLLFIYYFAFPVWEEETNARVPSFMKLGEADGAIYGKVMGMIFFLCLVFVIALSIATVYNLLPAIKNKEKIAPKKFALLFPIIKGALEIVVFIFSILAVTLEKPDTMALYIVTMPFTLVAAIVDLLAIFPFLKCSFYQPAVGSKLFEKNEPKEVEAE